MNSRFSLIILLIVLVFCFIFIFADMRNNKLDSTSKVNVETIQNEDLLDKEQTYQSENEKNNNIKDIEIIKDYAEEKSISKEENNKIKNTVENFIISYCSISEETNPKTRLESVKSLMTNSLYEELNNIINVETDLATEYYVYRNINKIVIHDISKIDEKISVGVSVFSDYLNSDLSTQIEDAPQDYTLTLASYNGEWIIESCVENFK